MASTTTRNLGRMSEIAQVAVKHGFGYFFETHRLTDLLPGKPRLPPEDSPSQRGQHLREMLDELGPTFVKFGQLLSTRPDVVPPDIVLELQALQDDVLEEFRDGQIEVGFVHKGLDEFTHKVDIAFNRMIVALMVAGGLIGSSLIGAFVTSGPALFGINFLAVIGFALSGALGIWLFVGILRSGRI